VSTARIDRNPEITAHMSAFIARRRADLGLSLDDVAKRCGSSKAHIWALENGRSKNPTLWMILALCDALQCSINGLLGRDVSQPIFTENEMALVDAHRRIFTNAADECQYAKDLGTLEHRCAVRCVYEAQTETADNIYRQAIEQAAKVAEQYDETDTLSAPKHIAEAIRAIGATLHSIAAE
jgi:transcriptional regulator with XRE-family HTH domain